MPAKAAAVVEEEADLCVWWWGGGLSALSVWESIRTYAYLLNTRTYLPARTVLGHPLEMPLRGRGVWRRIPIPDPTPFLPTPISTPAAALPLPLVTPATTAPSTLLPAAATTAATALLPLRVPRIGRRRPIRGRPAAALGAGGRWWLRRRGVAPV